jgi:PPOX class probable F420-dependent enzyme
MRASLTELPDWARELLECERVARLGLLDDRDHPRVLPVTFAVHEGRIWSAIDRKPKRDPDQEPARLRHIRRRPQVALTVDRYSDDWSRLAWVQVLGSAVIVAAADATSAMTALARKYEPYRREPPPGPIVRISPERTLFWRA